MANGLLNYYNQNGLLQDPSANIARQMTPQMQFQNSLLGMDLSPRQPTFEDQARTAAMGAARGLGSAFTGQGSSARLSALGASLLAGPSRTPISFGSSLAQGLLEYETLTGDEIKRVMAGDPPNGSSDDDEGSAPSITAIPKTKAKAKPSGPDLAPEPS